MISTPPTSRKPLTDYPYESLIWKIEYKRGVQGNILQGRKKRKTKIILRGNYSSSKEVDSGVPQCSVITSVMSLVYTNDLKDDIGAESYINMVNGNTKDNIK